jgi:hypothetical protein
MHFILQNYKYLKALIAPVSQVLITKLVSSDLQDEFVLLRKWFANFQMNNISYWRNYCLRKSKRFEAIRLQEKASLS